MRLTPELVRFAIATGLASIGLAAGGTGGALLATELAGDESVAGLPFGAVVAGSAAGAAMVARLTPRLGRGRALAAGYAIGVLGAAVVIAGAIGDHLPLVLGGSLLLGPANASVFLARYAGADLAGHAQRGRGLGAILFATALGAVLAPNLLGPSGVLAKQIGLSPYAGLYLVALIAFGLGGLILAPVRAARTPALRIAAPMSRTSRIGMVMLGASNLAMVGIMAVAPVHLTSHGHDLGFIGLAISVHVAGMLAPSPVTGWLSDRIGPGAVAAGGAILLLAAGASGALAEPSSAAQATGFLLALGLGWNLAVVAGSAMLTADLPAEARPRAEAAGEVTMGLAAAVGATGAGLLASSAGWAPMMVAAGLVGAVAIIGLLEGHPSATSPVTAGRSGRLQIHTPSTRDAPTRCTAADSPLPGTGFTPRQSAR